MAGIRRRSALTGLAGGIWGIGLAGLPGPAAAAPDGSAPAFVRALAARVIGALRDPALDARARLERIDAVTAGAFDLDRTARIALGRYWRAAPEAERTEFAALFKDYVLTSYGRRFQGFADRVLVVGGATPAGEDTLVASTVTGGPTPIALDWRLTATGDGWRVLDLMVEGVSLLVTFRNEFAAVIERHGGQVAGLLAELRQRVAVERGRLAG